VQVRLFPHSCHLVVCCICKCGTRDPAVLQALGIRRWTSWGSLHCLPRTTPALRVRSCGLGVRLPKLKPLDVHTAKCISKARAFGIFSLVTSLYLSRLLCSGAIIGRLCRVNMEHEEHITHLNHGECPLFSSLGQSFPLIQPRKVSVSLFLAVSRYDTQLMSKGVETVHTGGSQRLCAGTPLLVRNLSPVGFGTPGAILEPLPNTKGWLYSSPLTFGPANTLHSHSRRLVVCEHCRRARLGPCHLPGGARWRAGRVFLPA
jgi:hypothetical protein